MYLHGGIHLSVKVFSVDIPEGLTKANGYTPTTPPNHVPLVSTDRSKWDYNNMEISEVPFENLPDNMSIVDNITEGDLTIVKGQIFSDDFYPISMGKISHMQNLIKMENIFIC